jgi:hypothetical protein
MISMKDWAVFIKNMDAHFPEAKCRIMCTSEYMHQGKVVVGLLKYCLDHRKSKGVLFSIEKPYTYVQNIVKKQGISDEGLRFLGAVQKISSESIPDGKKAEILDGPFCHTLVNDAMASLVRDIDSGETDFIIIDNFRAMTNYVNLDCLYKFLLPLVKKVEGKTKPKIFMLVDHGKLPELPQECGALCQCRIDITNDWFE